MTINQTFIVNYWRCGGSGGRIRYRVESEQVEANDYHPYTGACSSCSRAHQSLAAFLNAVLQFTETTDEDLINVQLLRLETSINVLYALPFCETVYDSH